MKVSDLRIIVDEREKKSGIPKLLDTIGIKIEIKTLMVGDWPERDIIGAKNVGMKTAFARYGDTFGTVNSGADWDLSDIYQLVMIINEHNSKFI